MIKRDASTVMFLDGINRILLEDRRGNSKFGEEWGFFGGSIEKGETIEEALIREIKEELGFDLKEHRLFKKYYVRIQDTNETEYRGTEYIHLAEFPGFSLIKSREGRGIALYPLELTRKLKLLPWHYEALNELEKYIKEERFHKGYNSFLLQI